MAERQDGGLLAVTDNGRRAYEDCVVLTQGREAFRRPEHEHARLISRAFGEKSDHYQ